MQCTSEVMWLCMTKQKFMFLRICISEQEGAFCFPLIPPAKLDICLAISEHFRGI